MSEPLASPQVGNLQRLVLASGNSGKLRELQQLLGPSGIEVIAQSTFNMPDVEETGTTFIENALLKARAAAAHTGLPALADDSGLVVDALGGRPGVYSARYAGANASDSDNNAKLLQELADCPAGQRGAHYCCALILMRSESDPMPLCCVDTWHGEILTAPRGDSGFGYDPLFLLPDLGLSSAQLDATRKNQISHRGKALRHLLEQLTAS